MRAVLRYRQFSYRWVVRNSKEDHGIPEVPVALIPVLVFPGEGFGSQAESSSIRWMGFAARARMSSGRVTSGFRSRRQR